MGLISMIAEKLVRAEEKTEAYSTKMLPRIVKSEELMGELELVGRMKEGDAKAIEEIVQRYKGPLFAFILRMTNNHAAAEDLFQETWLRVIRYIEKFRGDSKFSTWLFQIALNLFRDTERKKRRWHTVPIEDIEDTLSYHPGIDPIGMFRAHQVKKLLRDLPVKMREVIVLRYYHDLSDREIAEIVGCPEGTVKSRFYRASEILRKKWEHLNRDTTGEKGNYEAV